MHGPSFETSGSWLLFPVVGGVSLFLRTNNLQPTTRLLLVAVDDATAVQVVGAKLDGYAVAGEDADEVLAHTA